MKNIYLNSSERFLTADRGKPQRIKTGEERDYISGI